MPDPILLCKDCKYCEPSLSGPQCLHPEAKTIDYVLGNDRQMGCDAMRIRVCGPQGRFFEPSTP